MVSNNADEVAKQLEAYSEKLKRKLEIMIAGFAGDVAFQAAIATPVASQDYVDSHPKLYQDRFLEHGIAIEQGFHQGSWQYSEGGLVFDPAIRSTTMVENQAEGEALANYKLGDTFYIGSNSPNMDYLNQRDQIDEQVDAGIRASHASNLQQHFSRG